jgi:hypothetical protein
MMTTPNNLLTAPKYSVNKPRVDTCAYSPQVEQTFVHLLWHHPQYIDLAFRDIDPEIHILTPPLRVVLQMVAIVWWNLGAVDWTSVVHALKEINYLHDVGGLHGLNGIFTDEGRYPEGCPTDPAPFIQEYIGLLRDYEEQRVTFPGKSIYRFTGGRGRLQINTHARRDTHPAYVGRAFIAGRRYLIAGWNNGQQELGLSFEPET